MEDTSESEETARIRQAAKRARKWDRKGDDESSGSSYISKAEDVSMSSSMCLSMPKTSGVFDYAQWVVDKLELEHRDALKDVFQKTTYMDLCAGLGTSMIANEALRRALLPCIVAQCTALTEKAPDIQEALRRRLAVAGYDNVPMLQSNAMLASDSIQDIDGNHIDRPKADILFMGIVCTDISGLSSTPKSLTNPEGASGRCWLDFLAYMEKLPFEELPKAIILECVGNLGNKRNIDGSTERGTKLVVESLQEKGYVGKWMRLSAVHFHLPQKRPRVWGLFLKVRGGVGPKSVEARKKDLAKAWDLIKSGMCNGHEPLSDILARTPVISTVHPKPKKKAEKQGTWKTKLHPEYILKQGLTKEDISDGRQEFHAATTNVLLPREQDAVWLFLCTLRKKKSFLIGRWALSCRTAAPTSHG